jgi:hypothetical protein
MEGVSDMGRNASLLKQFMTREGHCCVPQSHKEDGANLGAWVTHQRQLKRTGTLDADGDELLEEIGFEWVLFERRTNVPWEEILSLLKQFKKREGHCNVPRWHEEDGTSLGLWVKTQRQFKRKEKLDPDREEALEDIGFQRGASATWDETHAMLQEFKKKREGHCNVPHSHKEDRCSLGSWANKQRTFKKVGKPDPDRDKLLEEVGFQWMASATWDEMHPCSTNS